MKRWRHIKRGSTYIEVGRASLQVSGVCQADDGSEIVVYRGEADGRLWARPAYEFEDGRFEALPAAENAAADHAAINRASARATAVAALDEMALASILGALPRETFDVLLRHIAQEREKTADAVEELAAVEREDAIAAARAEVAPLLDAIADMTAHKSSSFRAGNNRQVGIQADDGEMCWIVHSEVIFSVEDEAGKLRAAISGTKQGVNDGRL